MHRSIIALTLLVLLPALSTPTLAQKPARSVPIQKLDRVSAQVTGRKLFIHASGAVIGGGWTKPTLRIRPGRRAEADTLVVDFLATPPPQGAAVIQGQLPVSATLTTGLPRYATTKVTVVSATNSLTAPIAFKR
ncbi:MAG: hypothetical protein KGR48_01955 [Alphaproteobacteria bacterium]|nr:hypothetical protein [Alphaproteobacteria bacterium]MDE2012573.1 hypothetical protein [Alphaproteobacteria bacterium]MDE2073438.1 hypothetical protein [Alphaproteobacteria bacterium]MDE2350946.1 hypothetical protein [Alphaproteobacteria bacterium]